jgi:TolB-like protein/Tfp pilus assembly protein PilF
MLQLQVLGSPTVTTGDVVQGGTAAQRKAIAVLALLAGAGKRGLSRDRVLALLWPETPADRAHHRLTQLLYSLRRDLGAADLFLGSADLRINPAVLATDLEAFGAALEAGDFERAVARYGGPFLDGFFLSGAPEFEHWVEEERARLSQRYASALEALARAAATAGDVTAAAGWWRQLAQVEPLNARVAVSYMESLGAAGDRPAALRFARAYETLLRQEYDTDPDPAVLAAAERLRHLPSAPAIAVLPFANLTPDGEGAYFSEGLTDELTNLLARVPGLRVASRTSVYALRDKGLDAREIGERLGVGALLEGAVRKVGNRIRLSARLVDPADGCQLWSESYERTLEDIFALQEELSAALVAALPLGRDRAAGRQVPRPTDVVDAYTLYLRGRYAVYKRTPEALALAIEYFEQAVERDPGYALAHAGIAECWALRGFPEFGDLAWSTTGPLARAAALEALRLDPRLAQAHLWLAVVHMLYDFDWAAAEGRFRRALHLDPRGAVAENWYAILLSALGRHDEALWRILHAEALEPLALPVRLSVARCYYWARRFEQAREAAAGLLRTEPEHGLTMLWLGRILSAMGRDSEAVAVLERLTATDQRPYARSVLANALAAAGRREEAEAICDDLERDVVAGRAGPLSLVPTMARLGRRERALELLRESVRQRDPFVAWVATDERYDPLRELEGFREVLRELRLEREVAVESDEA